MSERTVRVDNALWAPPLESIQSYPKDGNLTFRSYTASARAEYEADDLMLASITGYQKTRNFSQGDLDAVDLSYQQVDQLDHGETFSQELQAVSRGSGPLTWMAGLYYYHEDSDDLLTLFGTSLNPALPVTTDIQTPAGITSIATFSRIKVDTMAPYAQLSYRFSPMWALTIGGRYSWERKRQTAHNVRRIGATGATTTLINEIPRAVSFEKFTPKISLQFDPADRVMLYASWSRGFKSGGFSLPALAGVSNQVRPEILDAYELGWKTEFGPVRLNGAGFYYDYKDIQIGRSIGAGVVLTDNAASAKIYGLEAELLYAPTRALQFGAGANWLHSEFKNYLGDVLVLNPTGAPGYTTLPLQDLSGEPLPLAAKFSGYLRASYDWDLGSKAGSINFNSLMSYSSKFRWGGHSSFLSEPSKTLINAGINWTSAGERYSLGIFATNLLNEKYRTAVTRNNSGGYYTPGSPMRWSIRMGYKF